MAALTASVRSTTVYVRLACAGAIPLCRALFAAASWKKRGKINGRDSRVAA
jgi:hypothetical protein